MAFVFDRILIFVLIICLSTVTGNCQVKKEVASDRKEATITTKKKKQKRYKLPKIDLNHWKVTIPVGKPTEVAPPEILDYAQNEDLKPFMYNDSVRGALVFYAYPNATTTNTKYSRTELREQIQPGSNDINWSFKQGGRMKGKLEMGDISKGNDGKYHKTIIMQIHGRLTDEQRDLIGKSDNDAPPILKIYWKDGKIRVKTKQLKNLNASATEILRKDAWEDDEGFTFKEKVGFEKFILEVKVSEGKILVVLNNNEFKSYENIHIKKWGIFENYFKAGNYLTTQDKDAFAKVRYYSLDVSH